MANRASYPDPVLAAKLRAWNGVYTVVQQGKLLGVSDDTVSRWRQHLGISRVQPPVVEITPEVDAKIRAMFAEGAARTHVSEALGIGTKRLTELYPGQMMDPQTKGSLGAVTRNFNRKVRK